MSELVDVSSIDSGVDSVTVFLGDANEELHAETATVQELDLAERHEHDIGGPSNKRLRIDDHTFTETITINWNDDNVKQTIYNVNRALTYRITELERKVDTLLDTVKNLNNQLNEHRMSSSSSGRGRGAAIVVGMRDDNSDLIKPVTTNTGSGNVQLITLNSESDYPDGVWLGDENNPESRVRVDISKANLLHIHSNCRTPEKMALTLLDYLFDRDTLAFSNLSGMGKHGKKQLDPLKIYGIKCHLIHMFGVNEGTWHRIRLNIDSKCRTAYRRKIKGHSITPKCVRSMKDTAENKLLMNNSDRFYSLSGSDMQLQGLHLDQGPGELQIIHATEEQLVQLQQSHQIQILDTGAVEIFQHLRQPHTLQVVDTGDVEGKNENTDSAVSDNELEIRVPDLDGGGIGSVDDTHDEIQDESV